MRSSSNDIYTNGEYFKNNPMWGVEDSAWKAGVIHKLLSNNNIIPSEITEIGCGAGSILDSLLKSFPGTHFKGFDISPQAIELANKLTNNHIEFFNEDFRSVVNLYSDVVMLIDVLEHVDNFYGMLRDVRSRGKYFIFHIPLDLSCRMILKPHILLQQRESVGHIHYFSKEMVEWMLADTGFEIIEWVYTKPVVDVNKPATAKRGIKKILRNVSFSMNKNLSAKLWGSYSMMILAK